MNPGVAYTAIGAMTALAIIPWALIATGKLKTAGPARRGAATAPAPTTRTSGQPRAANGQFAPRAEPLRGVDAA